MQSSTRVWLVGLCGLVLGLLPGPSQGDDAGAAGARSGMRAYVDPQTGRLVPEPPTPPTAQAVPAPEPPLVEVPAPAGGAMIELKGRFMSNLVATVNPDGSVQIDCVTGDAPHPGAAPH